MEKALQKVKTDEILKVLAPFVICTFVTTLHSCCMKSALVFSQSEAHNFFMYTINQYEPNELMSLNIKKKKK